jgi:putative transposase
MIQLAWRFLRFQKDSALAQWFRTSFEAQHVEEARRCYPMWGKRKIAVVLNREGVALSVSTIGRILARLAARGAIEPVALLRRRPASRRFRYTAEQRYARRLPKGRKAKVPSELVEIDTLFINIRPDEAIKHIAAYDPAGPKPVDQALEPKHH